MLQLTTVDFQGVPKTRGESTQHGCDMDGITTPAGSLIDNEAVQAYMTSMEFALDKEKVVEALVYIASRAPGIGRFHVAKILYFAERFHLRKYGRPIVGDRYIAMENGPVPSFGYDILKGNISPDEKAFVEGALVEEKPFKHPAYKAGREPDLSYFSVSDKECLDEAVAHCIKRSFGSISDETHKHLAWEKADLNGPMSYDDILDGADPEIVEDAKAFAAYGVL